MITGAPGPWQTATVVERRPQTPTAVSLWLRLPRPVPHLAGQHYIVRLTAPDGYRAQRSYSVAGAPGGDTIELTVERLPGGEVSEFLHDVLEVGDELEVRGPVGGYFAWDATTPVTGVAGGSGIVPLMAMLRTARASGRADLMRLVVSARSPAELYYADELPGPEVTIAYTRRVPDGDPRPPGRLTAADLRPLTGASRTTFVCGTPGFCDAATALLAEVGVPTDAIRVERFGPSG